MSKIISPKELKESIVEKLYNYLCERNSKKFKLLEGRLLTLIDATFADPEQRKAQKDTVKHLIWEIRNDNDLRPRDWVLISLAEVIEDDNYYPRKQEIQEQQLGTVPVAVNYFKN